MYSIQSMNSSTEHASKYLEKTEKKETSQNRIYFLSCLIFFVIWFSWNISRLKNVYKREYLKIYFKSFCLLLMRYTLGRDSIWKWQCDSLTPRPNPCYLQCQMEKINSFSFEIMMSQLWVWLSSLDRVHQLLLADYRGTYWWGVYIPAIQNPSCTLISSLLEPRKARLRYKPYLGSVRPLALGSSSHLQGEDGGGCGGHQGSACRYFHSSVSQSASQQISIEHLLFVLHVGHSSEDIGLLRQG